MKNNKSNKKYGIRMIAIGVLGVACFAVIIGLLLRHVVLSYHPQVHKFLMNSGLSLEKIVILGNKHTDKQHIINQGKFRLGKGLMEIDLANVKKNIDQLPWVKSTMISRKFPQTIQVQVWEYRPFARWRDNHNNEYIIDQTGHKILRANEFINKDKQLPFIIGKNANIHCRGIISKLNSYRKTIPTIKHITFIDNRRWDVATNDCVIKLPEKNIDTALAQLKKIRDDKKMKLVSAIDLRVTGKTLFYLKKNRSTA